ncbi:MAG: hypothetical protein GX654_19180, partial [Desulfatiglans sp.]|nr:hypothetical protein [Desulfatiglans sp.]
MVNAKRIVVFIVLSILFILLQTPLVLAKESSSTGDESSFSSETEVTYSESTDEESDTPPP